jgi:hypothetical protein
MSRENVETAGRLLDADNDGDYETSIEALDPDVALWSPRVSISRGGALQGTGGVVSWFADWLLSFDEYWAVTDGEGDWVLAVLRSGRRRRASRAPPRRAWTVAYQCVGGRPFEWNSTPTLNGR